MTKVNGLVDKLAFWLGWIALLQGRVLLEEASGSCLTALPPLHSLINLACDWHCCFLVRPSSAGCMVKSLPYDYSASIEASPCSCVHVSYCFRSFSCTLPIWVGHIRGPAEASSAGIPA